MASVAGHFLAYCSLGKAAGERERRALFYKMGWNQVESHYKTLSRSLSQYVSKILLIWFGYTVVILRPIASQ